MNEICQKDKTITRNNVLMFRWAMQDIERFGERVLSPEELVVVTILLVDTDNFNDLGLDHDFFTAFIRQPEDGQKEAIADFENDVFTRLQIRAELSGIIAQESLILKSDTFRITNDVFWTKLRFE